MDFSAAVYTDASAALGIVQRRGVGKVRHTQTRSLWLQEVRATRRVRFEKIDGSRNASDSFVKHVSELLADRHMKTICAVPLSGRAEMAPELMVIDNPPAYLYGCELVGGASNVLSDSIALDPELLQLCEERFAVDLLQLDEASARGATH